MTLREQALRKRIEEMALAEGRFPMRFFANTTEHVYADKGAEAAYRAGANSLAPLLLELAAACQWTVKPGHDEPDDYTRLACAQHRANEALSSLDRFLSGGEGK